MKVTQYKETDLFYEKLRTFLRDKEAEYNLILGIAHTLKKNPGYYEQAPFMAFIGKGDEVLLAALMTPPHAMLLAPVSKNAAKAIPVLVNYLNKNAVDILGVNTEKALGYDFVEYWKQHNEIEYKIAMKQRVYRLDRVIWPEKVSGRMRLAEETDKEILFQWTLCFMDEAMGNKDESQARKLIDRQLLAGTLFVWEDGGQVVSMAAKTRETPNGAVVSFVFTPKRERKKGYATNIVAALSQKILDEGFQFCTLFTDLANPTSNAIYQKIGYKPVIDFDHYVFRR